MSIEKLQKVSQNQAMAMFGISRSILYRLRKERRITTYVVPGSTKVFFDVRELESLFQVQEA